MRRYIFVFLISALSFHQISAQNARELIEQNPDRAANIYHRYETFGTADTPAPKGYKAFYISHYGRHGSRYHTSESFYRAALKPLVKCDSLGLLTTSGKELLADIRQYRDVQSGLDGILTQVGSNEHKQIARRMYDRFPEVFNQQVRTQVKCISSISQRCLQSMANFTSALVARQPGLNLEFYTGEKFMPFICNSVSLAPYSPVYSHISDSITVAMLDSRRFMKQCFTDAEQAGAIIGTESELWIRDVFYVGSIKQDIEADLPDIFRKYFTIDELYALSRGDNAKRAAIFGNTAELGPFLPEGVGKPLLAHIIEYADEAVEGGNRAADLRFGHDTGLAPLFFLMGVTNNDRCESILSATDSWLCFREMCMCSNLQMVFYRNKSGDILVKILHNERETTIEAVPSFKGPYYRWSDLRAYLMSRLRD